MVEVSFQEEARRDLGALITDDTLAGFAGFGTIEHPENTREYECCASCQDL